MLQVGQMGQEEMQCGVVMDGKPLQRAQVGPGKAGGHVFGAADDGKILQDGETNGVEKCREDGLAEEEVIEFKCVASTAECGKGVHVVDQKVIRQIQVLEFAQELHHLGRADPELIVAKHEFLQGR